MYPPFSHAAYAREPSGKNVTDRGRPPVSTVASTRCASGSIANTWPFSSHVTYTSPLAGFTPTPSGSADTFTLPRDWPDCRSMVTKLASSSFAMNASFPSLLMANCSGSEPACQRSISFRATGSMTPRPSAVLSAGARFSSTPGAIRGEPLNVTKTRVPSGAA